MSSIVKDELDKIKSFADSTEKRGSKLTLNELNYISDKQLHSKGGSSSPVDWDFLAEIVVGGQDPEINLLVGDFQTYYNKFSIGSAISTNGMLYNLSGLGTLNYKITGNIVPFTVGEDQICFKITPVDSSDPTQVWTLIWRPDNSLELDTDTTPVT